MKKRFLALFLVAVMMPALLPAAVHALPSTYDVGGGTYAFTQAGLRAAIADAPSGGVVRFVSDGTISIDHGLLINKSITLNLNGRTISLAFSGVFDDVSLGSGYSIAIRGPGTLSMNNDIINYSALTVENSAVIEATGSWATLFNYGSLTMTGGTLRQAGTSAALLSNGPVAVSDAILENNSSINPTVFIYSETNSFTNCAIRNNNSASHNYSYCSVIGASNTSTLVLTGGSVTPPSGSSAPSIYLSSNVSYSNTGASVSGYILKVEDLAVTLSAGEAKATLSPQTPATSVKYYYKTTSTDDSSHKPPYFQDVFDTAGWTLYSASTEIPAAVGTPVYVQVVKIADFNQKICGWGQATVTPDAISLTGASIDNLSPEIGDTLTANVTPSGASVNYQWKIDGVDAASGGTGASYVVQPGDLGKAITVTATGKNDYAGTVTSAATNKVAAGSTDNPKTGDRSATGTWIFFGLSLFAGISALCLLRRRRKGNVA